MIDDTTYACTGVLREHAFPMRKTGRTNLHRG